MAIVYQSFRRNDKGSATRDMPTGICIAIDMTKMIKTLRILLPLCLSFDFLSSLESIMPHIHPSTCYDIHVTYTSTLQFINAYVNKDVKKQAKTSVLSLFFQIDSTLILSTSNPSHLTAGLQHGSIPLPISYYYLIVIMTFPGSTSLTSSTFKVRAPRFVIITGVMILGAFSFK